MKRRASLSILILAVILTGGPGIIQNTWATSTSPAVVGETTGTPSPGQASDPASARDLFWRGMEYEAGDGVTRDFAKAAQLYKDAISQGFEHAYGLLGRLYWEGWGVEQDHREAFRLYHLGLAAGDQWAQFFMGRLYLEGERVELDRSEAFRLLRLSAEQDNARALTLLAMMYLDGDVTARDPHEAKLLLERAASNFGLARRLLSRLKLPS